MKIFLCVLLVFHVVIEAVVGALLAFYPTIFIAELDPASLPFMTNLGGSVITMALVAVWFWPYRHNLAVLSVTLGILATYHTIVTCFTGAIVKSTGGSIEAIVIHGVFAAGFWYLWFVRRALATE